MCGIVASIPSDLSFTSHVLGVQSSRGPDQTSSLDLGFASLGANRLAISGVVNGPQPFISQDKSVIAVFNGAIYNVSTLQRTFEFELPSSNDGEVIPFLYQQFGLQFADYLEGMFAICIADLRERRLVLAVDQVGIKPLYTAEQDGNFYVASVVQAFPPELRRIVTRVPSGTILTSDGTRRHIAHKYFEDRPLGELLKSSVVEQIPEEVPWGCMLSGGIDSSLITKIANDTVPGVHTFTCGTRNGPDLLAGREVARILRTEHHEVEVDVEELPEIVDAVIAATASMETWTIMGGVGTYLVARAAKRMGFKVLLSGEGADELFGGYDEFQDIPDVFLDSILLQYQVDLAVSECLRLDRTTMAHSIEARVPFLCTSVMRYARNLDPSQKIRRSNGGAIRKFALREFARTILPSEVALRKKEEFSHGSGITRELQSIASKLFSERDVINLQKSYPTFSIDTPVSAWFFRQWYSLFGNTIGDDWPTMVRRGLFRQPASIYLPRMKDFAIYNRRDN